MKAIFCITGLAIQGLTISAQAQTGKPNIVVIMTDQQRADLCGREGFPLEVTPFVDRLAQENVWFNKAYTVMPASSPARCSMFTGRFPSATHVRTNHNIPDISYQQGTCSPTPKKSSRTERRSKGMDGYPHAS